MRSRPLSALFVLTLAATAAGARASEPADQSVYHDLDAPEHEYWQRELTDPFTRIKADFEAGRLELDRSSEQSFVVSLLDQLEIPATSQMLVFSTTSLQLRFISPRNPRAVYFNEDVYLGWVQGGRIEIISLDPEAGGVFYIFDIPKRSDARMPVVERSDRCMNCHAKPSIGNVPGITLKSVIPGPNGGSLEGYRDGSFGHQIPLHERFGGWHVTGDEAIKDHRGNVTGRFSNGKLLTQEIPPGTLFDWARYPVATSDILPHLIMEHQAGFTNRVIEAHYRHRHYHADGRLSADEKAELDAQVEDLTRYLLFAQEAELPAGGLEGDAAFKTDFLANRRVASNGASLKDFDLRTRLFKHRCSYMIYSKVFQGLPEDFKESIYQRIGRALSVKNPDPGFRHLSPAEKDTIRLILRETLER